VLSASQLKRAVRRGERVFLAALKLLDLDTTASESTTPSGQPDHPASEKPWVSSLVDEFSEVFQDPLPDGLPPERKEGHSIPTDPGHPPPFRQMYHLSPLEYRELEKQVTASERLGYWKCPHPRMVHLFCLFQSLMAGVCDFVSTTGL
jgi:hypothetical protein